MSSKHSIHRRDIHFDVAGAANPDWLHGDPMQSAFCDSLSVLFPHGERFFIQSIVHYLPGIKDPDLQKDIYNFIAQEGLHTREHEAYNQTLRSFGYPVDDMEARIEKGLQRITSPLHRLATTAAIEHLTATLGHLVLSDDRIFDSAPPPYKELWTWHCLEELEHKGVAFDVFKHVTAKMPKWKAYFLRCIPLIIVTIDIHRLIIGNGMKIWRSRGKPVTLLSWIRGLGLLFIYPAYYTRSILYYLSYYRPFFDPWKTKNKEKNAKSWRQHFNLRAGVKDDL
jgi:predicted metal-dependent hydrolase